MKSSIFTKKKEILFSFLFASALFFSSCGVEEQLTKEVNIDAQDITIDVSKIDITPHKIKSDANVGAALKILYDHTINLNVSEKLAEYGLSVDNIKTFALYQSTISVVPGSYTDVDLDLNTFKDLKLYFDNTEAANLAATVQSVDATNGSITFKIENPNQLDKLRNNFIHVIVAKETIPLYNVRFKMKLQYKANVGLFKKGAK